MSISRSYLFEVYPCFCIHLDTKTRIAYILLADKYIYPRIENKYNLGIPHKLYFSSITVYGNRSELVPDPEPKGGS